MQNDAIILVDVSYYGKWASNAAWRKIKDDANVEDNPEFDPLTLGEFKKAFDNFINYHLSDIISKYYPVNSVANIVFCLDCKRDQIWRKEIFSGYKYKRDFATKRFKYDSVAEYLNRFVARHNADYGSKSVGVSGAEADDIIGVLSKKLSIEHKDLDILIISGDSDLLQLKSDNIYQIDAHGELVTIESKFEKLGVSLEPTPYNVLMMKILTGDSSDSVPSIRYGKCGTKTAAWLLEDRKRMRDFINFDQETMNAFVRNFNIIALSNTPKVLVESIERCYAEQ